MKTLFPIIIVVLLPLASIRSAPPFPPTPSGTPVYDGATDGDLQQLHTDVTNFNTAFATAMTAANAALAQIQKDQDNASKDMDAITTAVQGLQKVMGDPSLITMGKGAATASSVQALESDFSKFNTNASSNGITYSTDPLKHFTADPNGVPEVQAAMQNAFKNPTDPSQLNTLVFNQTLGGMYPTPIGSNYTTLPTPDPKDPSKTIAPTSVARTTLPGGATNGTTYLPEASEMSAVSDYFTVRDAALTRREALQKALTDAVNQLDTAPDFATTAKISTLILALQAQMQACDNDVTIAFNDLAARGIQVYAMNSVVTKSSAEPATALVAANQATLAGLAKTPPKSDVGTTTPIPSFTAPSTPAPAGATAASGYSTNFLPWTVYK